MAVGVPGADAVKIAELMLEADLTGADAHGVFRLPQYIRRIKAGGVNPKPNITVEKTAPATAMVDGDNGMGHLVMQRAAETAIALAKENGVAWVGARRTNHAGAAGIYARCRCRTTWSASIPWSPTPTTCRCGAAAESLLEHQSDRGRGPGRRQEPPVVLDIATTVVSYGTVKAYKLQGKPMPEGWMIGAKDGKPITDSARSARRPADADRRPQGLGAGAGAGLARRHAQRRGVRPRRGRFQRRRRKRLQHRPFHHRARCVALHADRCVQGRGRPPSARSEIVAGAARASTRSACPASSAASRRADGRATAFRCFPK